MQGIVKKRIKPYTESNYFHDKPTLTSWSLPLVQNFMFGALWIQVSTNLGFSETVVMKLTTMKILDILKNRKHKSEQFIFKLVGKTWDGILLLHAFQSPFYCRILKKSVLISSFKNPYIKSAKQEKASLFMNSMNAVQEFHLWIRIEVKCWTGFEHLVWKPIKNSVKKPGI